MKLTESDIETATLDWLYGDVLLLGRLKDALARINPQLPSDTIDDVARKVVAVEMPSLVEENRRLHKLIVDGVGVAAKGTPELHTMIHGFFEQGRFLELLRRLQQAEVLAPLWV